MSWEVTFSMRSIRGGSWNDRSDWLRNTFRFRRSGSGEKERGNNYITYPHQGFRVARDVKAE